MLLVHSFPTVSLIMIYWATERLVIKSSHWKMVAPLVPIYSAINYFETKERGKPLYWFLTWEDWTSLVVVGALFLFVVGLWKLIAFISYSCKGPIP